jgi:biopolymer transport protein ExbD
MIVQPFNFTSRLRQTSVGFDLVPFIDACLILIFFSMLGSQFVVAPGLTVNLPVMQDPAADAIPTTRVLTVGEVDGQEQIFFDNRVLSLDSLERSFAVNPAANPARCSCCACSVMFRFSCSCGSTNLRARQVLRPCRSQLNRSGRGTPGF